jgi:hypothetical protein
MFAEPFHHARTRTAGRNGAVSQRYGDGRRRLAALRRRVVASGWNGVGRGVSARDRGRLPLQFPALCLRIVVFRSVGSKRWALKEGPPSEAAPSE